MIHPARTLLLLSLTGVLVCQHAAAGDAAATRELRAWLREVYADTAFPAAPSVDAPLPRLGKLLFFSRSLSGNRDVACASCHHPLLAGGDGLSLPVGEAARDPELLGPGRRHAPERSRDPKADGRPNVARNSPTTFNAGLYQRALFFDGRVTLLGEGAGAGIYTPDSLFGQADPLAGESLLAAQTRFPVTSFEEMRGFEFEVGGTSWQVRDALVARLRAGEHRLPGHAAHAWRAPFRSAFGALPDHELITFANVSRALAAYQRSQRFTDHALARFMAGDDAALSAVQQHGARLFFTPRSAGGAGCAGCHRGALFTDEAYHNIATPQLGRGKSKRENDFGRELVTRQPDQRYAFRTPSLLNVALTGPWGHAGAYASLEAMVRHHLDPERAIDGYDPATLPQFSDGTRWANWERNTRAALRHARQHFPEAVAPLALDEAEVAALVAFLHALTDPCAASAGCLAPWIPHADEDPDGWQLNARFASAPAFEDVTAAVGIHVRHDVPRFATARLVSVNQHVYMSGGVAVGDVDGDGWDDVLIVGADDDGTRLYALRNVDGQRFDDVTGRWGLEARGVVNAPALADLDADGDLDVVLGGVRVAQAVEERAGLLAAADATLTPARLLRNDVADEGRFADVTATSGLATVGNAFSTSFADIDADGDLDLFTAGWSQQWNGVGNHLWRNDGGLRFSAVDAATGLAGLFTPLDFSFTPLFTDLDGDRRPDLLIAGDFLTSRVLLQTDGGFVEITDAEVINDENGMGSALLDFDGDGDLDWFVTSVYDTSGIRPLFGAWGASGNRLYENLGGGRFADATERAGVRDGGWGWAACAADFDNDGDEDLLHVNGYGDGRAAQWRRQTRQFMATPARLFVNEGGRFVERAALAGVADTGQGRGVACFDFDRDGALDVLVSNSGGPARLYRNRGAAGHWLQVKLASAGLNTAAIGARIELQAGGRRQLRQVQANSNYVSQNPATVHFGLGGVDRVERLEVFWPDGARTLLVDLPADRRVVVSPADGVVAAREP